MEQTTTTLETSVILAFDCNEKVELPSGSMRVAKFRWCPLRGDFCAWGIARGEMLDISRANCNFGISAGRSTTVLALWPKSATKLSFRKC